MLNEKQTGSPLLQFQLLKVLVFEIFKTLNITNVKQKLKQIISKVTNITINFYYQK